MLIDPFERFLPEEAPGVIPEMAEIAILGRGLPDPVPPPIATYGRSALKHYEVYSFRSLFRPSNRSGHQVSQHDYHSRCTGFPADTLDIDSNRCPRK